MLALWLRPVLLTMKGSFGAFILPGRRDLGLVLGQDFKSLGLGTNKQSFNSSAAATTKMRLNALTCSKL